MSLSATANAVRAAVLRHMRLGVQGQTQAFAATSAGALALAQRRGFAGGGYLDKGEVTERVLNVAKHFEKIQADKVTPTASFEKDLGLDSLDVVELVMAFEEEFAVEIPDADADKIATVQDAVDYLSQHPMAK